MSSTSVTFTGYVHDADGVAVQGAIINLYKKNTSTPSLGSSTSDATGLWTLSSSVSSVTSSGGDIKIAHPTSGAVLWRKYDDVVQYKSLNVGHIDITDTSGLSTLDIGTITVRDTASGRSKGLADPFATNRAGVKRGRGAGISRVPSQSG